MRYIRSKENARMLLIAVIVGLFTGVAVWFFRQGIALVEHYYTHNIGAGWLAAQLARVGLPPSLVPVFTLALAGVVVGWIMQRFVGHETYHGVSSIMVAGWLVGGRLPYHKMPAKAVASAISLGAGASVGPEDPSVQIGANIGSFFGQHLRLSDDNIRLLVAAGAASAIAAAFNAPIAGVFFAIEVILIGDLNVKSSGVVMLAAVISSAFTQGITDSNPVFGGLTYTLGSPLQLPLHVILGVMLAFISWGMVRYLFWLNQAVHRHVHLPLPVRTGLTGAVVGGIGVFVPQVLGAGEHLMHNLLTGELTLGIGLLLLIGSVKIIATGLSQSGGFVGGVFAPSLFVGIMFGSAFGQMLLRLPVLNIENVGDPQSYAIAGMAGVLAGVVQAPVTAILLVFELTNDYRLILPIMLTTVTVTFGMSYLRTVGIYFMSLLRDGINLEPDRDIDVMQGIPVSEAMATPAYTISQDATLPALRDALRKWRTRALCVVDERGKLRGIVTLGDLQRFFEQNQDHPEALTDLPVSAIATPNVITIYPDDKLWTAIQTMGAQNVGRLPVVERLTGNLVGIVSRRAIIQTYNQAITRKLEGQHHTEQIRLSNLTGATVMDLRVTPQMAIAGKRIRDLILPQHFVIASIQRGNQLIVPRGYTEISSGDVMTLVADPHVIDTILELFTQGPIAEHPSQETREIAAHAKTE